MEEKLIGKMTINEVFPHLDTIAKAYGLTRWWKTEIDI